jgi:hypothetical protein
MSISAMQCSGSGSAWIRIVNADPDPNATIFGQNYLFFTLNLIANFPNLFFVPAEPWNLSEFINYFNFRFLGDMITKD